MPGHQVLDRRVLEQVAAGAGEDRVEHVAVLVGDRQHEHPGQRRDARDLPGRLDAGHPRHVQVHHDDVGGELADHRAPRPPSAASPTTYDPLLLEQVAQTCAKEVVVVDEQDAERVVPRLGRLPLRASSSPCVVYARKSTVERDRHGPRPQASACAAVGNQRSIVAPRTAAAGVGRDTFAVARDRHARAERDHRGSTATTPQPAGMPLAVRPRSA